MFKAKKKKHKDFFTDVIGSDKNMRAESRRLLH